MSNQNMQFETECLPTETKITVQHLAYKWLSNEIFFILSTFTYFLKSVNKFTKNVCCLSNLQLFVDFTASAAFWGLLYSKKM